MILKLRDNVYIGDKDALKEVDNLNITAVVNVADDLDVSAKEAKGFRYMKIGLSIEKGNPSYVKDLAAHACKEQVKYDDKVLVISVNGYRRAAYIGCRIICELEDKGIYEILQEVKELKPDFKMGEAYL